MASPVVQAQTGGGGTTNGATMPLPSGITSGEKVFCYLTVNNASAVSTPSGWTKVFDVSAIPDISLATRHILYVRDADGTEGTSVAVTWTGGSVKWASISYRISGADAVANWETSTRLFDVSRTADVNSFSPSGGTKDWLWIYFFGSQNTYTQTAAATGYTNLETRTSAGGGSANTKACSHGCTKSTTATSSEDAPGWTIDASVDVGWEAWVVAVPPGGAVFTDSATVYVDLQASGTEIAEYVESNTILVDLQASGTDLHEIPDAATVLIDLQASGTDAIEHEILDSATVYLDLQTSDVQVFEAIEAATVYFDLQVSDVQVFDGVDSATVLVDLQASGTDEFIPAMQIAPQPPIIVGGVAFQDRSRW